MKLYKFRSLASEADFDRVKGILETGKFWHSKFSELNDPIEGGFTIFPNVNGADREMIDRIYGEKNEYKICSFSNQNAFTLPTLWGYYANGFKGVAVEIEVKEIDVCKVEYVEDVFHVEDNLDYAGMTKQILTRKFTPWEHEGEFRSLVKLQGEQGLYKVGNITSVFFGYPYQNAANRNSIYANNQTLKEYSERMDRLLKVVKKKEYKHYIVVVNKGKVEVNPLDPSPDSLT